MVNEALDWVFGRWEIWEIGQQIKWEMGYLDPKWEQELGDWENMRWEQGDWPKKVGDWEIQTPHRGPHVDSHMLHLIFLLKNRYSFYLDRIYIVLGNFGIRHPYPLLVKEGSLFKYLKRMGLP
jgi:hypothetical protein